jgi:hypothetical protein
MQPTASRPDHRAQRAVHSCGNDPTTARPGCPVPIPACTATRATQRVTPPTSRHYRRRMPPRPERGCRGYATASGKRGRRDSGFLTIAVSQQHSRNGNCMPPMEALSCAVPCPSAAPALAPTVPSALVDQYGQRCSLVDLDFFDGPQSEIEVRQVVRFFGSISSARWREASLDWLFTSCLTCMWQLNPSVRMGVPSGVLFSAGASDCSATAMLTS